MKTVVKFLQAAIVTDRQIQNHYPEHYSFFNKIEVAIQEAWNIWDNEIISTYYEGNEKPEEPTESFGLAWIQDSDLESDGFDVSWIEELA